MKTRFFLNRLAILSLFIIAFYSCEQGKFTTTESAEDIIYEAMEEAGEVAEDFEKPIEEFNTEEYDEIKENEFLAALENPLSTFSIDVDNASYSNVRRMLQYGEKPPKGAVRIEEMINYFNYDYPDAEGEHPFSINTELTEAPWNKKHQLLRIGIQGRKINYESLKPSNIVLLVDTSGSMEDSNKLPLVIKSFKLMVNNLPQNSRVAIVTYAGSERVALESTSVDEREIIFQALDNLEASGSTNGSGGIEKAYEIAQQNLIADGNNRIVLATDGDFNVGKTNRSDLVDMIAEKARGNIFLTICGFGMGNYKDGSMEALSNRGNGNYFYIDNASEAKKVFKKELTANLFTIAKDVKIQVEFNPNNVEEYRLIGYENRLLNKEDFNDDTKDAGELGAGHQVTALYEIVPKGVAKQSGKVDDLKYQNTSVGDNTSDLVTLKLRYKKPKGNSSKLITKVIRTNQFEDFKNASDNQKLVASVAGFGMLLRDSKFKGDLTYKQLISYAKAAEGDDTNGYRTELQTLLKKAKDLEE